MFLDITWVGRLVNDVFIFWNIAFLIWKVPHYKVCKYSSLRCIVNHCVCNSKTIYPESVFIFHQIGTISKRQCTLWRKKLSSKLEIVVDKQKVLLSCLYRTQKMTNIELFMKCRMWAQISFKAWHIASFSTNSYNQSSVVSFSLQTEFITLCISSVS